MDRDPSTLLTLIGPLRTRTGCEKQTLVHEPRILPIFIEQRTEYERVFYQKCLKFQLRCMHSLIHHITPTSQPQPRPKQKLCINKHQPQPTPHHDREKNGTREKGHPSATQVLFCFLDSTQVQKTRQHKKIKCSSLSAHHGYKTRPRLRPGGGDMWNVPSPHETGRRGMKG